MASVTDGLRRGLLAGLVGGLAFALFVAVVATPMIGLSESLAGEDHEHADDAAHDHAEEGIVSETVSEAVSLVGAVALGLLAGVALGVGHYVAEPALPGGADLRSYLLAAAGFVTASGAPWLVLPPVPPGTEEALAVETRLWLYAGAMVAGAVACGLSLFAYRRGRRRRSTAVGLLAATTPLLALLAASTVAPTNAVSGTSPELIAAYRGVVLVGQVFLWGVVATAHATLFRSVEKL